MASKKESQAREMTPEDVEHVRALHERVAAALSLEQVEANYRMSLGLPDASGRTPSSREQLGATKLFADLLLARPKPEQAESQVGVIVVQCPYCAKPCACGGVAAK